MAEKTLQEYRKFDSCIVADALHQHGIDGIVDGMAPANPSHTAVGLATPINFERVDDSEENSNFPYAMLEALDTNRMMVIDGISDTISCWGGRASMLADNAGASGIVVNGGYRDINEIREGTFPVFGTGHTPRTGQRRVRVSAVGDPVSISGVNISEDDIIVADSTGVVVVPYDMTGEVLQTADKILAEELLLEKKIEYGATVEDLRKESHDF